MRIMIGGVVRDMTAEEEAQFIRERENLPLPVDEKALTDKAEAYDILMGGD